MTVTFNPFNPFSYWSLGSSKPVYPTQPSAPKGAPIDIKTTASDPGLKVTKAKDSVTIRGTTKGAQHVESDFGGSYDVARGMSFTLDIDKAPTVDVFGHTDYTEKNSRLFTLTTSKGWSAEECANRLAAKVNAQDDFRAKVTTHRDGSATISFTRR